MERYLFIALTLGLTVYGQLIVKSRAIGHAAAPADAGKLRYLVLMFSDPLVLSGLVAAVAAAGFWMLAIQRTDVGFAYPFMALSFVLVPAAAAILFREPIPAMQVFGLALIVVGVGVSALAR